MSRPPLLRRNPHQFQRASRWPRLRLEPRDTALSGGKIWKIAGKTARDLAIELKWLSTPKRRICSSSRRGHRNVTQPGEMGALGTCRAGLPCSLDTGTCAKFPANLPCGPDYPACLHTASGKLPIESIETDEGGIPAVSPDGRFLVTPVHGTERQGAFVVESLQSNEGKILTGTEGAGHVFWSPESRSSGFLRTEKLKRIDIDGSSVYNIADAALGRGGTWNSGGTILFSPQQSDCCKVPASGGTPVASLNWTSRTELAVIGGRNFCQMAVIFCLSSVLRNRTRRDSTWARWTILRLT